MKRRLRPLLSDDLPAALALCRAAGWNQLREDWNRLLEQEPEGCFAIEIDDQLAGTVTTTRYGAQLAWIGMMLVREDFQRQGIARELIGASLDYLRQRGVMCIKLDATPAGWHVYRQLGFQDEWPLQRWARDQLPGKAWGLSGAELTAASLQLDRRAFAVDRAAFLQRLARDSSVCTHAGGFGMLRRGYLADYLGPVVAEDSGAARAIISELLQGCGAARVFWDVIQPQAATIAASLGFTPVRPLTRMWTGSKLLAAAIEWQYAISDPGTG
jgi:GNAT superfamily N-acetyltransferase